MSNIRDIFERARKASIREAVEATFTPKIRTALGLPPAEDTTGYHNLLMREPTEQAPTVRGPYLKEPGDNIPIPDPLPLRPGTPKTEPLPLRPVLPKYIPPEQGHKMPEIKLLTPKYGEFGIVDDNDPEYNTDSPGIYRKIVDNWYEGERPPREIQGLVEAMEIHQSAMPMSYTPTQQQKGLPELPGTSGLKIESNTESTHFGGDDIATVRLPDGGVATGVVGYDGVTRLEDGSRPRLDRYYRRHRILYGI